MDKCPYCQKDISGLPEAHSHNDYASWFDLTCPYCEETFEVEVIPIPEFVLHKKEKRRQS